MIVYIWKIFLGFSFLSRLLFPYYLMTRFFNINHSIFYFAPTFLTQNTQFLQLFFSIIPLCISKIQNGFTFFFYWQNQEKFDIDKKKFVGNSLMIFIVLIWYLVILNSSTFLPVLTHSTKVFYKWTILN